MAAGFGAVSGFVLTLSVLCYFLVGGPTRAHGVHWLFPAWLRPDVADVTEKVKPFLFRYKHYRLPTETEWEYACRAGTKTAYYTGDGEAALAEAGWYSGNSGNCTHPVVQKKPNACGLYDMHGNVYQWCSDRYGSYPAGNAADPTGPAKGDDKSPRVMRGGSWCFGPRHRRSAGRDRIAPFDRHGNIGFRVCLDFE